LKALSLYHWYIGLVKADTGLEVIHQGCVLEKDGLFDQILQVISFTGKTAGDEGGAQGDCQGNGAEGNVLVPWGDRAFFTYKSVVGELCPLVWIDKNFLFHGGSI
jgi:hypothetical protein